MNDFLLDIWRDLREKRLWPIGLVLVVALVVAPVLLLKGSSEPDSSGRLTRAPAQTRGPSVPIVSLTDVKDSSDLEAFEEKDPFKSLLALRGEGGGGSSTASAPEGSISSGTDSGSSAGSGGSSDLPVSSSGGPSVGAGSSGGSGGGSSPTSIRGVVRGEKTVYTYVADLEFGKRGEEKVRKGVERLQLLPSEDNPLIVFLGVTTDEKTAVFLVESSLKASGEGTCQPNDERCSFLFLQTADGKDQHFFTDQDGNEYGLKLLGLRRVTLKSAKRAKASAPRRRRASERRRLGGWGNPFGSGLFADARG
jgi:hypothetical protein